ncbi:MAG: helix-hairpin-helix domain-containing protein [Myxococcales bacterium]|jgi:hypothetical protein|nr:helix-hairpin-helix domain-containing protein [Myxococcales bacterium]
MRGGISDATKGRRVRALALLQAALMTLSLGALHRRELAEIAPPLWGYQAEGVARIIPGHIAPRFESESALQPLPHWPLAVSLLFDLPIQLNALDATDFETLPGVGPVLAQRIVAQRAARHGFERLEDLCSVYGLGERKYELILAELGNAEIELAHHES